jgi:hypothetical protein
MVQRLSLPITGLRRGLYVVLGLFFVGLGVLGALLPILPTTPFLLLASWFFVHSSPALQAWLLRLPVFGSLLRDWETQRAVPARAKWTAYVLIPSMIAASTFLADLSWPMTALVCALGGIGLVVVWRLPVAPLFTEEL